MFGGMGEREEVYLCVHLFKITPGAFDIPYTSILHYFDLEYLFGGEQRLSEEQELFTV